MKKIIILALAVILVIGLFAGCSANGYIETPNTTGNVSTTRDGRVNGTNQPTYPRRTTGSTGAGAGSAGQIGMGGMA